MRQPSTPFHSSFTGLTSFEPFFAVNDRAPALFALRYRPVGPARARVLVFVPFAEEMNKCRRMVALGARALADAGAEVLVFDPRGCGDSAADFGDATWDGWVDDASCMLGRFDQLNVKAPLWLWGIRAGALLACAFTSRLAENAADETPNLLFWAPVVSGKQHLQQFLRMKLAADLAVDRSGGRTVGAMAALRRELDDVGAIEIAGYRLHAGLARSLENAKLRPPAQPTRVVAIDVVNRSGVEPSPLPATATFAQACLDAGHDVVALAVHGPAFWQTVEIEEAPALLDATTRQLMPT